MGDDEVTEAIEGSSIDRAVREACTAVAEGDDDVKIEFELGGILWRLRVEAVGFIDNDGEDD